MSSKFDAALDSDKIGDDHALVLFDAEENSIFDVFFAETCLFDHKHICNVVYNKQHYVFFFSDLFHFFIEFGSLV